MLFLLLCGIFFMSCDRQPSAPGQQIRAETAYAEQDDGEILRIAIDARRTLPIFFRQLARGDAKESGFSIKHPFRADDGSGIGMEQLWLDGIHFKDGVFFGILAGDPAHVSGMQKGDTVALDMDAITDWMYVRDGKIAGGRSIKYLLEQIPESQRSEGQRKILRMFE
ncbi:MAG: DUF2314 domain-containing protein [Treponema sp.]|jgi:uncharacterized protein YegJ (DUF2314 family)|nr:DUF2314 domain-containing protein [Treponema sp.]